MRNLSVARHVVKPRSFMHTVSEPADAFSRVRDPRPATSWSRWRRRSAGIQPRSTAPTTRFLREIFPSHDTRWRSPRSRRRDRARWSSCATSLETNSASLQPIAWSAEGEAVTPNGAEHDVRFSGAVHFGGADVVASPGAAKSFGSRRLCDQWGDSGSSVSTTAHRWPASMGPVSESYWSSAMTRRP